MYMKCLWVLLTNVYWFRATGGYICGCGRPSNLVIWPNSYSHYLCTTNIYLGKVGVGSNIDQNHLSSLSVISGHYWPQFTWIVYQKLNYVKLESVWTLLKITRLASGKSYLIIIGPNHMENWAKFKLYQAGVGSNIAQNHSSNISGVSFGFNSNEKCTKSVIMSSWDWL